MYLTMVRIYPSSKDIEAIRAFLLGLLEPTRVQSGCLDCTLATDSEHEALLYLETWDSEENLHRRLQSDEYGKVLAIMELSITKPGVHIYHIADERGLELIENIRLTSQDDSLATP